MKRTVVFLLACGTPHPQPTVSIPPAELDAAMVTPAAEHDGGCRLDPTDSDGDGILDACDRCPTQPENLNGVNDEDGCPDVKVILESSIRIIEIIVFPPNQSEPLPASAPILDAIADVMKQHSELELVGVVGHVAPNESAALAMSRASRVVALLVKRGVAANRLEARAGKPDTFQNEQRYVRPYLVRANGKERTRWNGSTYDDLEAPPPTVPAPKLDPKCPLGPIQPCSSVTHSR